MVSIMMNNDFVSREICYFIEKFETAFDGVDFVCRCYAVTGIFFSYQLGASKNLLISSLFDEVFEVFRREF